MLFFPKTVTLAFAKHYSLNFGFSVVYDNSRHFVSDIQMRIHIYK